MKVVVHVDGGARGNPGPAAIGVVVSDADGGLLDQRAELIGVATNNVAEYRALLLGLERARALGASEVEVVNDSELVAKQVNGAYKVKHAGHEAAARRGAAALGGFERWACARFRARRTRSRRARQRRARRRRVARRSVRTVRVRFAR